MGPYYDQAQIDRFSHARDARLTDDRRPFPAARDRVTGPAALFILAIIGVALWVTPGTDEANVEVAEANYSSRP